jgi:BirA family biotin operon repressor/biotin-[acetyl-CoA-carboxylase] ligase
MRRMMAEKEVADLTVVWALDQTAGRGQPGRVWHSERGKNLTFSILKKFSSLQASDHFLLNMAVSRAVYRVLENLLVPDLRVKWPNDILSGPRKLGGILIENHLQGARLVHSIIGIGLNVNQEAFGDLPKAASLLGVTGRAHDLEPLLNRLCQEVAGALGHLPQKPFDAERAAYEVLLFRKDRPATFSGRDGILFPGIIRGVSREGFLVVEVEKDVLKTFDFRSVSMHF